jgi:hypothetical protein
MDSITNTKPLPHRELHGEVHARSGKKLENGSLTEGTIQTNLDWNVPKPISNLLEQETKTIHSALGVVNSTRPVHDVEKLTCLREMCSEGIVGRVFWVMGIEAVLGAVDRFSRTNDGAIEIDREASKFPMRPS